MKKDLVSAILGCSTLAAHSALTIYLFMAFERLAEEEVAVSEISVPITVVYAITVVKWLVDTQGHIRSEVTVGFFYFLGVLIVSVAFFLGIVILLRSYAAGDIGYMTLNSGFTFLDSAIGALLVLFYNDLFAGEQP